MYTFSLICEGVTDQKVLTNILTGYFDDLEREKVRFTYAQPQQDVTDQNKAKQVGGGGFDKVIRYCESEDFQLRIEFSDYIIIQIDTDAASHYKVDLIGNESIQEIIDKVQEKIISKIGVDFFESIKEKVFFAICVHSLECWLLPLYYNNNRQGDIHNCIRKLNQKLPAKRKINESNKNTDTKLYNFISRDYLKQKILFEKYPQNPSFEIFISSLNFQFHLL